MDSPEIAALVAELEALRWTGRKGYPIRSLVGACLAKSMYAIPTWSRTAALIAEHAGLQAALGGCPSVYACYRFCTKLREHKPLLDACLSRVLASLNAELPAMGEHVAIDASDMPAFANGQRFLSKNGPERERYSDPDASWGHRSAVSTRKGGGFYGYKVDAAVDVATGLPLAWEVRTASIAELHAVPSLLDAVQARGFRPETMIADKGYDYGPVHDACHERSIAPVVARRRFANEKPIETPSCEHGEWTFAGADFKRKATKWRCPTGDCQPKSAWIKADRRNPLIPRSTKRWGDLYRGRASVEREFGRLKHEWGLSPLRVRGLAKVALHADLTMLARLAAALARARPQQIPLAA